MPLATLCGIGGVRALAAAFLTGGYPHCTGAIDTLEERGLDRLVSRASLEALAGAT